jgi:hypothetical protein
VPYQTIATDDIGKFAALAFEQPGRFIGGAVEIAGSELTNPAAAEVFSRLLGRRVKFQRLPMPVVRVALGREFYQMFRWFNAGAFQADVAALRRDYPQLRLRTLEDWLREEGWAGRRAVIARRDKIGRPLPGASPARRSGRGGIGVSGGTDLDWTFGGPWPFRPRWFRLTPRTDALHRPEAARGPPGPHDRVSAGRGCGQSFPAVAVHAGAVMSHEQLDSR